MSAWLNPDSTAPVWIRATFSTEPCVDCATASRPGTPQLPPSSQARLPGGLLIALAIRVAIGK